MVAPALPHNIAGLPDELVTAVAADAARNAAHIGLFLKTLCRKLPSCWPMPFPAGFLADLGAAVRLMIWEKSGLRVHLDAGLPPAEKALRDVMLSLPCRQSKPWPPPADSLAMQVFDLSIERFAWSAHVELDADVAVEEADEDAILEVLAKFLLPHHPG
jgi:hypothetical protein